MLIVHLFVNYAYVNLCHFFWCRGLAAASACGSSGLFCLPFSRQNFNINEYFVVTFIKNDASCLFWINEPH